MLKYRHTFSVLGIKGLLSGFGVGRVAKCDLHRDFHLDPRETVRHANNILEGVPSPAIVLADFHDEKGDRRTVILNSQGIIQVILRVFCPWFHGGDNNFNYVYSFDDKRIGFSKDWVVSSPDRIACSCLMGTTDYLRERARISPVYREDASQLAKTVDELQFSVCHMYNDKNHELSVEQIIELSERIGNKL